LHFTPAAEILTSDASCSATGMINVAQNGSAAWNYTITDNNNATVSSGSLNQSAPVMVSANAGTYTLTLVDNTGYTVAKTILVGGSQPVVASFAASIVSVQAKDEVTFTSTTQNATGYVWEFGDGSTATGEAATHNYTTEGVYNVKLTATSAAGCISSTSRTETVTSRSATGINNLTDNNKINIWSNANNIYVDFSKIANVNAQIEIFNVLGQSLSNEKFGSSSIYSKQISNLEAAYLIIRVNNNNHITTQKVFVGNAK
jgi:PKD repeat protein